MAPPVAPPRELPAFLSTAAPVEFGAGFFAEESAERERFRWMGDRGLLTFTAAPIDRFLELMVLSEFQDGSQILTADGASAALPLIPGWRKVSVEVAAGVSGEALSVSKIIPGTLHPQDARRLSIRVRSVILHSDDVRHRHIVDQHANSVCNVREMLDGRAELSSTPRSLGIDLYGVCNVKPPCVYCEWDSNKNLEGDFVDAPFGLETLEEWGAFFDNSSTLVNCSIGEPFMMKNIDELLDVFGNSGKVLEMTSNGQILTDRNIEKLLGRPVDLYVSLDAATPETYEKLRNTRFAALVDNLRRLINAKGGPGHLPRVHLVFMPMQVNVHELDAFVRLCADLRADRLVLRPLNYSDSITLNWKRAGYQFDYRRELLPFKQLVWVSGRAAELCRRAGVELSDQMDFGGGMDSDFQNEFDVGRRSAMLDRTPDQQADTPEPPAPHVETPVQMLPEPPAEATAEATGPVPSLGHEHIPVCTEPWKSLYILRRGVFPCCYGRAPVAPMDGYRGAWNSPLLQDIRRDLAQGRFHVYCLGSRACPIVRKLDEAHKLPARAIFRLRLYSLSAHSPRVGHALIAAKRAWAHTKRILKTAAGFGGDR